MALPSSVSSGRASARPEGAPRKPWLTYARRDALAGYVFIAPQLIGIVLFVLVPLGLIFYYAFHEWNVLAGTFTFVGLENVDRLFSDPQLAPVLTATGVFSIGLVIFNLSLALLLAVLLNRRWRGVTAFRTIFFSPVVVSLVAWTIVWGFLLQDNGGINGLLAVVGIDGPNWLREGGTAMASVIVVQVFKNVGLNMVLFLAALQGVPRELQEAARVDGASDRTVFTRIVLPLISPTILLTLVITIVGSLQVYAQIAVLTQGGPGISTTVLVYYLVQQAFEFHQFGYGSTLAILLFLIVLVLTVAQWQLRKRWVFYEN
ncbi:sugar ABC transporter permease [Microbacterium sp. cx-55]|uniref:carbohydrate ABC transporter permease n=1 Tax=unclassified Microbacterium TaxID=2609290 RepID=UPI001CBC421E|nr:MULTISPECIES: sugar ABC transporter permease [unclassified Microbacterium]MBZ4488416.1 sugar ABC transporter permease [Microbacterium sp. cx-55]MCC4909521.1 sugar ABC transporter permease [Microbacterium sp. cx-59]UGB35067.1 sugar ABC transporter permease [Microbacterium sp. cx-55]